MAGKQNVFLVGPMGAGKTTIGKQLAEALGLEFFDSDHEIENRTGARISLIFDIEGESGFRVRESRMIDELTRKKGIVLATGGGAVLDPENRSRIAGRGTVIYLHCAVTRQLDRTRRDRNRPLLQTEDPRARLQELMDVRDPLYREVADWIVDTQKGNTRNMVKKILRLLDEAAEQKVGH